MLRTVVLTSAFCVVVVSCTLYDPQGDRHQAQDLILRAALVRRNGAGMWFPARATLTIACLVNDGVICPQKT